jgi:hypothetical protein
MIRILCLALTAMALVPPAAGNIIINEVLYDPAGADTGYEFVELIAPGEGMSLDGVALEFCNGSEPGTWTLLWQGGFSDSLIAGGLFLLGESLISPPPDAMVVLGLQNAPDALRLTQGDLILDLLGYGQDLPEDLCETWPAADTPSGRSLARLPDGVDTDQNVLDFFDSEPTPGELNDPDYSATLLSVRLPLPPPRSGSLWKLSIEVENRGRLDWPSNLNLKLGTLATGEIPPIGAGHRRSVEIEMPPIEAGIHELEIRLEGDGPVPPDSLNLRFRVGHGSLLLSEVLFAPLPGRGEWVECLAPDGLLPTGPWSLSDLGGGEAIFQPMALAPGERIILCQNRDDLLAGHPELLAARIIEIAPWPSLANGGESSVWPPWSDGLNLRGSDGLCSDGLLYRGDWIMDKGWSLERLRLYGDGDLSAWSPCPSVTSPLTGPGLRLSERDSRWRISPQPFDPTLGAMEFLIPGIGTSARLRIFDAAGRPVQEILGAMETGNLRLLWDGKDRRGRPLPSGAYPYSLSWEDLDRSEQQGRGICLLLRSGV